MAYVEHKMWDVLEVLKHIYDGNSIRLTSRLTGRTRKTVGRYIETAENLGWVKEIYVPDDELASEGRRWGHSPLIFAPRGRG